MLEILYLSNYKYILYRNESQKLFLNLTRESGFGVYDFCFEADTIDINNKDLTINKIEDLRNAYINNPTEFESKYEKIQLESSHTKSAIESWMNKQTQK